MPYVTHRHLGHPRPDRHCPAMIGESCCILPLAVPPFCPSLPRIHLGFHPLGLDILCPTRLALDRNPVLDRSSAPVPPSHHPHRRNLRRFGVHGCPEVVQAWH